eukprot:Gregarina_sp_Poly_1__4853@NODE_2584_length_1944_cov_137_962706_g1641_i0_p1_GENE_NODE_2584_length_1944_cov_137_962706_g1641_i0NODE_2584_length_1944_cov_137_962706_g1641_i0_p1_ORF_typecomplete_len352_score47_86_NODE_2584_length_1944_cov_137_962706_g1641_i02671322
MYFSLLLLSVRVALDKLAVSESQQMSQMSSLLRAYCYWCCITKGNDDVHSELKIEQRPVRKTTFVDTVVFSKDYHVDESSRQGSIYNQDDPPSISDNFVNEEEKSQAKERIKKLAKGFWEEALNGIPASRFSNDGNTPQSYPVIFRLSRNLEFSTSQVSIHPNKTATIVESHSLSQIRSVRRGTPGVPHNLAQNSISIWMHNIGDSPPMYIGLLLANKQEQERFYVSLSIFQIIASRLLATRSSDAERDEPPQFSDMASTEGESSAPRTEVTAAEEVSKDSKQRDTHMMRHSQSFAPAGADCIPATDAYTPYPPPSSVSTREASPNEMDEVPTEILGLRAGEGSVRSGFPT